MITPGLAAEIEINPTSRNRGVVLFSQGAGRMAQKSVRFRARQGEVGVDVLMAKSVLEVSELIEELEKAKLFLEGKETQPIGQHKEPE